MSRWVLKKVDEAGIAENWDNWILEFSGMGLAKTSSIGDLGMHMKMYHAPFIHVDIEGVTLGAWLYMNMIYDHKTDKLVVTGSIGLRDIKAGDVQRIKTELGLLLNQGASASMRGKIKMGKGKKVSDNEFNRLRDLFRDEALRYNGKPKAVELSFNEELAGYFHYRGYGRGFVREV